MSRPRTIAVAVAVGIFAASAATAAREPLPLSARVIKQGELPGFIPQRPMLYRSVQKWASVFRELNPTQAAAYRRALRRDGFSAALFESLAPRTGSDRAAQSWVVQFRSPAAAKAELGVFIRFVRTIYSKPGFSSREFQVDTIPRARGLHDTRPGFTGENIVFSDGPFLYVIGFGWAPNAIAPPPRQHLLAAATALYKRVRGHPAA